MSEERYFNFPIQMLSGFINDTQKVLNEITDYAIYEYSLKLEFGNELERIKPSADFYGVNLSSEKKTLDKGIILYNSIPINSPKVGLNILIFWDFYKNDKTEFEKVCLLIFLSIKSVLGKKTYCKTNKQFLFNRVIGSDKNTLRLEDFDEPLFKYANNRRLWDKINLELQMNWGLKYYSNRDKGFYVSFIMDETKFYTIVMEQKNSLKVKQFKDEKKVKIDKVKQFLEQKSNCTSSVQLK